MSRPGDQRLWQNHTQAGIRHVRIHDMRHTYASRLVQNGAPLQAVSRLLGHSDIRTTMRYAHLSQHNLEAAAALFDAPDGDEVVTSATG